MTTDVTAIVIGAGQAGLAMSAALTARSIDHLVLERGVVANAWRTERWDSLRLLSPNWMTRLPGHRYDGSDPDGYMRAAETAAFLDDYRRRIDAPVRTGVCVDSVEPRPDGRFDIVTDVGEWCARAVVDATGACTTPRIPELAGRLPASVQQLAPIGYRNPDQVDAGRVLVVGGSASGVQIADELARAGRDVTIAVGSHTRAPRRYRGMDVHWWMNATGLLEQQWTDVDDLVRVRRTPSFQLVGSPESRDLDLSTLQDAGVTVAGRLAGITEREAQFSGSLANVITSADLKMKRMLSAFDEYATSVGLDGELQPPARPAPVPLPEPTLGMALADLGAVVWATGYRPDHPAFPDHVKQPNGAVRHVGGVVDHPGLFLLGQPFLRRRGSVNLDGVGADALDLAAELQNHLNHTSLSVR